MHVVEAKGITKTFPGVVALDNVDLNLTAGSGHCIVGENGAGKSTLVKVLTGVYHPDGGEVIIHGVNAVEDPELFKKIAYVPQEITLFPHMTVAQNLFMPFEYTGMAGRLLIRPNEMRRAAARLIERFQIHAGPDSPVKNIRISDQQLLQIARASTIRGYDVLILDEPTTSLSAKEIDRLFDVVAEIKASGVAVVFISHKLDELYRVGEEVTVMRNGQKIGHAFLKDLDQRSIVKSMAGEDIDVDEICRPEKPAGEVVLKVENLAGEVFENVSFEVREGEILGFAGLVGAGRSEIMQTLFGYLPCKSGSAVMNGRVWQFDQPNFSVKNGLYYLPEERRRLGIFPKMSVRHNIGITLGDQTAPRNIISLAKERALVSEIIDRYGIKTPTMDKSISNLSGGNQQKTIIGRTLANAPKVLVFDEPTKGIDVKAKNEIYHLLKRLAEDERLGVILISSEIKELLKCANRILTVYGGKVNGEIAVTRDTKQSDVMPGIIGYLQD
jgi:ribose transport system ATP-binding protein